MYIFTEIFFTLTVALIFGVISFVLAATAVLVKAGFCSSVQLARRIRIQVAAQGLDRQDESLVARVGSPIS